MKLPLQHVLGGVVSVDAALFAAHALSAQAPATPTVGVVHDAGGSLGPSFDALA